MTNDIDSDGGTPNPTQSGAVASEGIAEKRVRSHMVWLLKTKLE